MMNKNWTPWCRERWIPQLTSYALWMWQILLLNIGGLFDSGSDLSLVFSTSFRKLGAFLDQLGVPELFLWQEAHSLWRGNDSANASRRFSFQTHLLNTAYLLCWWNHWNGRHQATRNRHLWACCQNYEDWATLHPNWTFSNPITYFEDLTPTTDFR